jgi:hypothetical protein
MCAGLPTPRCSRQNNLLRADMTPSLLTSVGVTGEPGVPASSTANRGSPQLLFALRLERDAETLMLCCRVQGSQFSPGGRNKPSCMAPHVGTPVPGTACLCCFGASSCHTTLGVSALQIARSCKHTRCLSKAQRGSSKPVRPQAAAPLELQSFAWAPGPLKAAKPAQCPVALSRACTTNQQCPDLSLPGSSAALRVCWGHWASEAGYCCTLAGRV